MYVYKITNKINNKSYIGITNDIIRRFSYHKRERNLETAKEYSKPLYAAIRKHGIVNFEFSILEEGLSLEDANRLEIHYIIEYSSLTHQNGYNIREGGNLSGNTTKGENHYFSKLTENEVKEIILDRDEHHLRPIKSYQKYKDKVAYSTFEHIWLGRAWKHLQPSTIIFVKHENDKGEDSSLSKLTNDQVVDIIFRRDSGTEHQKEVYKDYKHLIAYSTFYDIWKGRRWKHLQPEVIPKQRHGKAYLTDDKVREIKNLVATTSRSYADIGKEYGVPASTISNIINNKTYKHVI